MAHIHANTAVTSSTVAAHSHTADSTVSSKCSLTGSTNHSHPINYGTADSHNHTNTILAFSSASLGSPNWWEHVHAITLVSMNNGGSSHTHTQVVSIDSCDLCVATGEHGHVASNPSGLGGAAHTHTIPAGNTDYATQAGGSASSHVHTFSTTFDNYSHNHSMGTISSKACALAKVHTHTHSGTVATANHNHTGSGTSASGGEGQTGRFFKMF